MSQTSPAVTYNEPTVMWRMQHPTLGDASGLIIPGRPYSMAVWSLRGLPQDAGDFREWRLAILWLSAVCRKLRAEGWQFVEESAERISARRRR